MKVLSPTTKPWRRRAPSRPIQFLLAASLFLFAAHAAAATTWYVRPDGGSRSQCTGTTDAKYPGSGTQQACAFRHPFEALPPGAAVGSTPLRGGDTLMIKRGSYEIGIGATAAAGVCNSSWSGDCTLPPIPSGPSASQPTRILGEGWNQGCAAPPELWGSGRVPQVISLDGSSNVEVGCLDLTDHSACIDGYLGSSSNPGACNRASPPYGPWAQLGVYAADSSTVTLRDVRIHGFANAGIKAARLHDWTLQRVRIIANGWAGWDGDLGPNTSSNSGQIRFDTVEVAWNGCAETYPGGQVTNCWAQQKGGYGDGLGTARTGGHWVFVDSWFHHNTSDGLDLLYADGTGSITVERSRFESNAGNQAKLTGNSRVVNSVIDSNCAYFEGKFQMQEGVHCRALGNALVVVMRGGTSSTISYNSIIGQGDCLVMGADGTSASRIKLQNNLLVGFPSWPSGGGNQSCLAYWDGAPSGAEFTYANNLVRTVRNDACPSGSICNKDPKVVKLALGAFDAHPMADSPLRGAANGGLETVREDHLGRPRPTFGGYDAGAYQYQGEGGGGGADSLFKAGFERN
jgi:hypothetical protein